MRNGPAPKNAARKRLKDVLPWEVSPVDKPANQRPFILVKNEEGATPVAAAAPPGVPAAAPNAAPPPGAKPDDEPVAKQGLGPLKPQVKQAVLDAVTSSLEKLESLASSAAEAPVDENAATPPELMKLIEASVSDFTSLVAKLAPPAGPTPDAPVAAAAGEGGAPAAAPAAAPAPATAADLTKAMETFVSKLKSADDEKFARLEKAIGEAQQKAEADKAILRTQLAATKTKLALSESRLAIGQGAGDGNSRPSDGANASPPAKPHRWASDLAAPLRGEQG
jgi:hypothetical protein